MKKRKMIKGLIILLCMAVVIGAIFCYREAKRKKSEAIQEALVAVDYKEQNKSLPWTISLPERGCVYVGYDSIDEAELYVYLAAYNGSIQKNDTEAQKLTVEDVKDYLSSEYNEDGTLRICSGYENIRAYVEWYFEGGDEEIDKYWRELGSILIKYAKEHPEITDRDEEDLNIAQLQELIQKKNDPSYEINFEVMKE